MSEKSVHEKQRCPRCNSTQVKVKEYSGKFAYMGKWIHCSYCKRNTPLGVTISADFVFNIAEIDQ